MRFAFDAQQLEFRAQLRAYLDKECAPASLRAAWASELGWSRERWRALAEMGVVGLTTPEEHGGLGLGPVDLVGLLEEAGRAGAPEPLVETVALAAPLLVAAPPGADADRARTTWLPRIASGEVTAAVAMPGRAAIPAAIGADLLILRRDESPDGGDRLSIVAVAAGDVAPAPAPALDGSRRAARVALPFGAGLTLAAGADAIQLLAALERWAATATAAFLLGLADRMITMTGAYATERKQFGRPIGSFQAVKHHLANALVHVEMARPVVYRAAWSEQEGRASAGRDAAMAKAVASDAATFAARVALQVHGAIGYTWEHDLHLFMKRAWALAAAWGDAPEQRARVLGELTAQG